MWTVFLDIDSTLIRTQGAGLRSIETVMNQRYGVTELPKVAVHGRTDYGIWSNVFAGLEIEPPEDFSELIAEYCELLKQNLQQQPALILPGVPELVQRLHQRQDISVGLLTGNAKLAAEIKMELSGLSVFVSEFGGFGDLDVDRNLVAERAAAHAKQCLKDKYCPDRTWVFGDSDRDISCARHIGANVLAVATGVQTMEELQRFEPDVVVVDFSDVDAVMACCFD